MKAGFSKALAANPQRLHFAAHSHHLWPDVTEEAHARAWDDAARLADAKWEHVMGAVLPEAQRHIARALNVSDPSAIAFAPNTHELLMRLLSCLPPGPRRILTTGSEFHSAARQFARLEEEGWRVTRVATEPFDSFVARFAAEAEKGGHDLIYVSQVFFDSGFAADDIASLVRAVRDDGTLVAVDGYHGFMALPTDLRAVEKRTFYLAGGYKYAMAGEGVCFMHCPPGYGMRPVDTGWYAAFGALEKRNSGVSYGDDGFRFMGATFDPSGLYRFNAVQRWLHGGGIAVADIHRHVQALQSRFLARLQEATMPEGLSASTLMPMPARGHFLTFRTSHAAALHDALQRRHIVTDVRGDRLRIGFGLYHGREDIDLFFERLGAVNKGFV